MARALSDRATLPTDSVVARRLIRNGAHTGHTSGMAPEFVQGNLCILPAEYAADFAAFCQRNPKPCPLIGMGATGDPRLPSLAEDLDIRTDVPRYRVFRDGKAVDEPTDIMSYWRDDLVSFVLGCSFSFEQPLIEHGVRLRHVERGDNVAMYKTDIDTVSAGSFGGKMVVSMRPLKPEDVPRTRELCARFPFAHGEPVHVGEPEAIGIGDLGRPDFGDAVTVRPGEVPVFWACGVTPQTVIEDAKPPFCITHKAGHMLVTDRLNEEFRDG